METFYYSNSLSTIKANYMTIRYSLFIRLLLSCFCGILLLSISGCYFDFDDDDYDCIDGRGSFVTETYDLSEFRRISNSLNADVRITTRSTNHRVTVTGQNNVLEEVTVRIRGGELILEPDKCLENTNLQVDISLAELTGLFNAGSADIKGTNIWETDELVVNLSGSGTIDAILAVSLVNASIAGSGLIDFTGSTEKAEVSILGSGDYMAFGLETGDTNITISGSGKANIYVSDELSGAISGSGSINYKGTPSNIDVNITGSGRVVDSN
ncbi:MAG: head GIN domain-containing protein [Bacteroidota bacterium]